MLDRGLTWRFWWNAFLSVVAAGLLLLLAGILVRSAHVLPPIPRAVFLLFVLCMFVAFCGTTWWLWRFRRAEGLGRGKVQLAWNRAGQRFHRLNGAILVCFAALLVIQPLTTSHASVGQWIAPAFFAFFGAAEYFWVPRRLRRKYEPARFGLRGIQ